MNDTPPRARLANTECLAILTSSYLVSKLDDLQKRALFRAVHALARVVAYKERAARNKADKAAPPMTEPSAPAPDAAETPNKE